MTDTREPNLSTSENVETDSGLRGLKFDVSDAVIEKHSVTIAGHRTSVTLERGFWRHLRRLAARDSLSINELMRLIDEARGGSLSGAARAYVLQALEAEAAPQPPLGAPH